MVILSKLRFEKPIRLVTFYKDDMSTISLKNLTIYVGFWQFGNSIMSPFDTIFFS